MSLRSESRYRRHIGKAATTVRFTIRRMIVKVTTKALWQVLGAIGEDDKDLPVFSGIGAYSRPPDSGTNPEVIVLKIGGKTAHPVIVATRDEDMRLAIAAIRDLAPDESAIFNRSARVHVKSDGTVLVDDGTGAVELALKSDVDDLETFLGDEFDTGAGHTHTATGSPPTSGSGSGVGFGIPSATGTTVLKGK